MDNKPDKKTHLEEFWPKISQPKYFAAPSTHSDSQWLLVILVID